MIAQPINHFRFCRPTARVMPLGVLVGGTRQRHFDGTNSKPRKQPENAPRSVPPPRPLRSLPGIGCTLRWAAIELTELSIKTDCEIEFAIFANVVNISKN